MSHYTLGIDTSNYATSLAVFHTAGEVVCAKKRFLPVKAGQLGLRQSDALFHHTAALPEMLEERTARLDTLAGRLQTAVRGKLQAGELRLKHTAALAASLNPYGVLARGYAMVQDNRGRICTPDALRPGQTCKLRGTEHRVTCTVNTVEELDESTQKL